LSAAPLEVLRSFVGEAWLVGGALRDELLGRATSDLDVAVAGEAREPARALARAAGGHPFTLSEAFGAWRVVARDGSWQVDLTPLLGETLEQDLARRDLTVNAIARPLGGDELIDPHGGRDDLAARRLRMVGSASFSDDPLRVIRLARLATELDFEIEEATLAAARRWAPGLERVAAERIFMELRLILGGDRAPEGLRMLESLGVTAAVLPELARLHGVGQSDYHHLDVHDHTVEVLEQAIALERDPEAIFPGQGAGIAALLSEPLTSDLTRGTALRFGALLHDIAKAATRGVTAEGRVTFMGHDRAGAETVRAMLGRLRAGERLVEHVAALTRHHLRLGFLVHRMPVDRHEVYEYLRACEPVGADVTLLSVADRLATRGRNSDRAIELHLELARQLLGEALRWRREPPRPPIRGDRLAAQLGIAAGPELGRLLGELTEAAYVGEVSGEDAAVEWARRRLAGGDR
jgi:putative nucleotidyltransferase with HDIG domain